MLRLANGGVKAKKKALEVLGELGDSRAIDLIHSYLSEIPDTPAIRYRLVDECLTCLGSIGNPRSFLVVRDQPEHSGLIALGGIRHPEVQVFLERYRNTSLRTPRLVRVIEAVGRTRSRDWFSFYEWLRQLSSPHSVLKAMEHAERNVHPEFEQNFTS